MLEGIPKALGSGSQNLQLLFLHLFYLKTNRFFPIKTVILRVRVMLIHQLVLWQEQHRGSISTNNLQATQLHNETHFAMDSDLQEELFEVDMLEVLD